MKQTSNRLALLAIISGLLLFALSGCSGSSPTRSLDPTVTLSTQREFILGNDCSIQYLIGSPYSNPFTTISLHIFNRSGIEVFRLTNLPQTSNQLQTVNWPHIKWNMPEHFGAFANPANGPYLIQIQAVGSGRSMTQSVRVTPRLVIECDVTDRSPAGSPPFTVAGLDHLGEAIQFVITHAGSQVAVFKGPQLLITNGEGHNPPTVYVKHVKVVDPALNSLRNADYKVEIQNIRDDVGDFSSSSYNLDLQ